ncbi:MAG: hypothetical protein ACR2FO_05540 [Actinomycetota bacterium]
MRKPKISAFRAILLSLAVLSILDFGALLALKPAAPPGEQMALDRLILIGRCDGNLVPSEFSASCQKINTRVTQARFLQQDAIVVGTLDTPNGTRAFWTSYPNSKVVASEIKNTLKAGGAELTVDSQIGRRIALLTHLALAAIIGTIVLVLFVCLVLRAFRRRLPPVQAKASS